MEKELAYAPKYNAHLTTEDVLSCVEGYIAKANNDLKQIVASGFPFSYEEVIMSMTTDTAGIYVHSGLTPVCSVVRAGNPRRVLSEIEEAILNMVDDVRVAVERRSHLKAQFDALKADSEDPLVAAGLDQAIIDAGVSNEAAEAIRMATLKAIKVANRGSRIECGEEAAEAIRMATMKAIKMANRGLRLEYGEEAVLALGGAKLTMVGFSGGLAVLAGGKPCIISHFPKVGNNKTVENMICHIVEDVKALGESRRRYLKRLSQDFEREARLHEIASKIDSAEAELRQFRAAM